ncbi:unnamed protein product [Pieris macdunnoughi]|uniref:RING-CH-type domain-containing protein n=1 Tax=Pieris macdunnoughi TaxID=345717 RepID=A0A821XP22_9NEOP|nr:unnamed protein product [Pieris macdunnoughi]
MDDEEKSQPERIGSNQEECTKNILEKPISPEQNDAGPSRIFALPGSVSPPHNSKLHLNNSGRSKSEHSIRNITPEDLTNALKLTSLSSEPKNPLQNINFRELHIPILDKIEKDDNSATLIELKKFMASCFKHKVSQDRLNQSVAVTNDVVLNIPNATCTTKVPNEVTVDPKQSKERKKSGSDKPEFVTQRDSLSSIGSNVCRICMTRGRERLISPCNCKGSLANVHLSCLERWLNQVGRNHCELCGFSYPAIRTPRYTVLQALRLWFGNPRNRSHLQSDCLIFWLLSTVTAGLLAVCIVGTQYFVIEGNKFGKLDAARKDEGIPHRITETAMDFFMAIVLCGYSVTVYLLWKDHYVMWNRWRRANVNVRLLLSPDANPVPFVPRPRYNIV